MRNVADQLREALARADEPITDIARDTGIHKVNLYQFRSGKRDLPLKTLEIVADYLNLQIVVVPKTQASTRASKK